MKRRRKRSKTAVYRILLLILISLVIGGAVYGWNAKNLGKNRLPMPFGYGSAVVLSGSMEPALSVNDWIFVKAAEEYQIGDIVVFQSRGELIVHRVIAVEGETIQTQGDANSAADPPVALSSVKGRVIGRVAGAGVVVKLAKSPVGVFVILAAAVFLTELSYRGERQSDDDELEKLKEEIRRLKEEQDP